jgi:hypothetical protein
MPDQPANLELLRSLGRMVRGLSALFWGLPLTLIVCVETLKTDWLHSYTIYPALATTGLLLFGLWQLNTFQKQERPWRNALDRAEVLALINFGLSPFLYWWNRVPEDLFFGAMVCLLAVTALLFLFALNLVLQRLGAMLPDETLRLELRQYTPINRILLIVLLLISSLYAILLRFFPHSIAGSENVDLLSLQVAVPAFGLEFNSAWVALGLICLFVLLPLAMTMALIWKTKEVILDSVFSAER